MLVSHTEILVQDLRREDLVTGAVRERAALAHRLVATDHLPLLRPLRQVVGAVLIRAGTRLTGVPRPEPAVSPPLA